METVRIELPPRLIPVFQGRADVRGAYGGRGSGKTRSFATMAAVYGYMHGMQGQSGQILCCRQFMNSLDDSSLEECKRAIEDHAFLSDYYEIGDKYIKSRDGRIWFSFAGLDRNIASVKSKGRILLCWVDEAEPVTDNAFNVLVPTLREEGENWNAELWITYNPGRKKAAVETRFRNSKDPLVKMVALNWRDNPKFPAKLERERQRDLLERPDEYDHIWEGAYGVVQGSILGKWVSKAIREGRINPVVSYDYGGAPIVISSDLGFRDTAAWWFWQRCVGGFRVLKYVGESGLDADDWIPKIQEILIERNWKLDKIWLPHDAKAKTFQSKHTTMEKFLSSFGPEKVAVVPQSKKSDQISAARKVIDRCEFHVDECEEGIDGLSAWEFAWNPDTEVFSRDPLHNWASHPADAFAYGCQVMQEQEPPKIEEAKPILGISVGSNGVSLDELWKQTPRQSNRL